GVDGFGLMASVVVVCPPMSVDQVALFCKVALAPLPLESTAVVPAPSRHFHQPARPGKEFDHVREPLLYMVAMSLPVSACSYTRQSMILPVMPAIMSARAPIEPACRRVFRLGVPVATDWPST